MIEKGIIEGFNGSWSSGIAQLMIKKENQIVAVNCDNSPTVRALDGCFDVISAGHSVDMKNAIGREIFYSVDGIGILEGFTPVEEASEEIIKQYEDDKNGK